MGGDTTSSKQGLVISVTSIGYADEQDIVYRNGAQDGDLIMTLGAGNVSQIGPQVLEALGK